MTWLGKLIYRYRLSKWPDRIPYENLSKFITWKLQQQGELGDLTVLKWAKRFVNHWIKIPLKGWWFRKHYYYEDGKLYNSLTSKYYYIHDEPGLYKNLGKPCKPNCKHCRKVENTYGNIQNLHRT